MEKSKTIFKKLLDWGKGDIKTRRYIVVFLGIIIILIVIIVGIVLIFKEPNIKFGSELEITPKQAKEKEQLSAHHKELKEGLQVLKQLPIKSLPRTLKDSIAKLIYLQTTDLNQADELLQTYEIYDKLSKNERIEFIGKVLSYLSEKSHPLRQKNYVEIARRIVSSNNEQMRIDSINRELERSKKRVGEMENLINKLSNKYQIDLQRNNQLLFSLINDSAKNGPRIDSLKSEIIRLREEKEQLLNDMQLYYPLRITNCSFASPGCRSKKDGSYLVGCMFCIVISQPQKILMSLYILFFLYQQMIQVILILLKDEF